MPDDDWQLAQGTVDFRNEERLAARGIIESLAPTPRRCPVTIDGHRNGRIRCVFTNAHERPHRFVAPDATFRLWPVGAGDPPAWDEATDVLSPVALCPNCLVELDEDNFCGMCGKMVKP